MSKVTLPDFSFVKAYVIQDRKTIMVDTGCYYDENTYREMFAKEGIDPKEIELIILTHGHWDHCTKVKLLKKITGAKVLCHKNAVNFLRTGEFKSYQGRGKDGQEFIPWSGQFPVDMPTSFGFEPDIVIGDEDVDLLPYGVKGKIIYTPGHTDGSISVVLEDGTAIVGDTMVVNPFKNWRLEIGLICDDEGALRTSVRKILDHNIRTIYCGHCGPHTREEAENALLLKTEK